MVPDRDPWVPWVPGRTQKVLGMTKMTKFPKSSGKYLGKSEDTRTQDPHQQMRNEKLV